ncbi:hypothetical protein [Helicobacter himalayensis]|uniref:hypothetical protein n=1 Tax=Helicobacter himalayensis TaxID=1591088 RepID=UPI001E5388D0|nr:hypothetical protein [Helicobacter himalayensis]
MLQKQKALNFIISCHSALQKNRLEFQIFDNWQNLVYIDAYSHAQITQNNNANVLLSFNNNDAIFTDFNNNKVCCENDKY